MIRIIAKNEILSAVRNRTAVLLTVIFYLLAVVSSVVGWKNFNTGNTQRTQAKEMFRKEWVEQRANPHSAAHFGTYLFKPFTFISIFDPGLNNYTGISYRVEAHNQAEMNYAAAQDSDTEMRFGELTIASLFQLFLPLLIIFLCFRSVSGERESQTLQLLYAQGLKPAALVWGKIAGNYLLVVAISSPVMLFMLLSTMYREPGMLPAIWSFNGTYLVYFLILTGVFVSISAASKRSKNALLASLGVWILCFIVFPKVVAGISSRLYPLPSRGEFNKMVETANAKGLPGDQDRTQRYQDYLKKTLAKFKVDSVNHLPVNFDGLNMQNGEDYLSKVYVTFNGQVEANIRRQQTLSQLFGFLDPFLPVQQLSMGFAGTDYANHIHFHKNARVYRDEFIRKLNIKMAYGDSNYLKYDYEVGPEFFKSMKDFQYRQPGVGWVASQHPYALGALFFWLLVVVLIIYPISTKIAVN